MKVQSLKACHGVEAGGAGGSGQRADERPVNWLRPSTRGKKRTVSLKLPDDLVWSIDREDRPG